MPGQDTDTKYLSLFYLQPDAVILSDRESKKILDANKAALDLYGYNRDEFFSLKLKDISLDPEQLLRKSEKLQEEEGSPLLLQYHQKKDHTIFHAAISVNSFDLHNKTICCASVRDAGMRKFSEEELNRSKDLLDIIVNSFNGFIYTVSDDYKVAFMNEALINHIGYNATGEYCFQLIHGLDERCPWCVGETVLSGRTACFEMKCPRNNRWYYYVSSPRLDPEGKVAAQQLIAIDIHERKRHENQLLKTRDYLKKEVTLLRSAAINRYGLDNIIGQSLQMQKIYNLILEIASSDASVLIYGESGTGKELVARAIHNLGKRKDKFFLPVNCGGIPDNLIESEFFGYKKGAFTGANSDKSGFFEVAEGGTIFLDEIGEINLNMQIKLLRAIDGNGYTPIGSNHLIKPDVRILAAVNLDPDTLIKKGHLRHDFFFRINVVQVHLPPLRERKEDIPLLIYHFLRKFSSENTLPHIPANVMKKLENYDWPGNVRELENSIHRYQVLNRLDVFDSFTASSNENKPLYDGKLSGVEGCSTLKNAVQDYEKHLITRCLKENNWKQARVASILGINRKTLYHKINKHIITRGS